MISRFTEGALVAIATVNACEKGSSLCANAINELGLGGADCSDLSEFDKENLRMVNVHLPTEKKLTGLGD